MANDILVPFLAALQASVSVLLTILVGVIAVQFELISEPASKEVSKLCTKLFLPALLVTNVGSQLHWDAVCLSGLELFPTATVELIISIGL